MDLSGVIFVVLALAWAAYLIPKTLKQHDEVARTRSIDRFSGAMRVLARREPVDSREAALIVTPPAPSGRAAAPAREAAEPVHAEVPSGAPAEAPEVIVSVEPATSRGRVAARRQAARVAARRRRRVLTTLLLCDLAVAVAAWFAVLPRWSVVVPVVVTALWLALCRTQVRRETARDARMLTRQPVESPVSQAVDSQAGPRVLVEDVVLVEDLDTWDATSGEDTQGLSVAALQDALAVHAAERTVSRLQDDGVPVAREVEVHAEAPYSFDASQDTGSTLWDPLPVTLPTYVTKAKARRTVRTIDLSEPGTWTSGHTEQDSRIVARSTEAKKAEQDGSNSSGQRVVGG